MLQSKISQALVRVVSGTVLSRILGFIRDILSAMAFGAGPLWDAFLIAFTLPNVFRRILGEGAFSSAFIPMFAKQRQHDVDGAVKWASVVLGNVIAFLLVLGSLGSVLMFMTAFFCHDKWGNIASFSGVLFPLVVPVCAVAGMGALLNAYKVFTLPALASSIINLFWIVATLLVIYFKPDLQTGVMWLCFSLLLSGLVQFVLHFLYLRKFGCQIVPRFKLHKHTKDVLAKMLPALLGLGAVQINTVLDRIIASVWAPDGGVSVLFYANRIMQFPLALIGIAVATASFPYMADAASKNNKAELAQFLSKAQLLVLIFGLPALIIGIIFAKDIVDIAFVHGAFGRSAGNRTATALIAYLTGLIFYCGLHPLVKAFHSLGDMQTPAKISGLMVILNLILNLILVQSYAEVGLAVSTAICGCISFLWHLWLLYTREDVLGLPGW